MSPWFKVDDAFALSPKVISSGNAAVGLWVRAGSWSMQQLTDGFIPEAMIAALGGKPRDAQALVAARLWEAVPGGFAFHDWAEYQPTREKLREEREATRKRVDAFRSRKRDGGNVTRLHG